LSALLSVHFTFYLKAGTVEQQGNGTRGRNGQRMRNRMNVNSRTGRYILRIRALYPKSADLTAWISVKTAAYRNVGHLTARKAVTKREDAACSAAQPGRIFCRISVKMQESWEFT
jgi:hypothetical protein